uniref:Uncharacterized protein n=1 Tax=Oryza sativa subsp. japonica TaxID=39947 RepID=Q5KQB5_ORYSJ|nr:hypothetical protein [Oryza sativa Japonica Group]
MLPFPVTAAASASPPPPQPLPVAAAFILHRNRWFLSFPFLPGLLLCLLAAAASVHRCYCCLLIVYCLLVATPGKKRRTGRRERRGNLENLVHIENGMLGREIAPLYTHLSIHYQTILLRFIMTLNLYPGLVRHEALYKFGKSMNYPPELLRSSELPPEQQNRTFFTLNYTNRTNYPPTQSAVVLVYVAVKNARFYVVQGGNSDDRDSSGVLIRTLGYIRSSCSLRT